MVGKTQKNKPKDSATRMPNNLFKIHRKVTKENKRKLRILKQYEPFDINTKSCTSTKTLFIWNGNIEDQIDLSSSCL